MPEVRLAMNNGTGETPAPFALIDLVKLPKFTELSSEFSEPPAVNCWVNSIS